MRVANLGSGARAINQAAIEARWPGATVETVDADPASRSDHVADLRSLPFADGSLDGVWASHVLEHFYEHELVDVLSEMYRVLCPGGQAMVFVPDLQAACREIAAGRIGATFYTSPSGPVRAIDMLYGHAGMIEREGLLMAHHTGFDARRLDYYLQRAGFTASVAVSEYQLIGEATK